MYRNAAFWQTGIYIEVGATPNVEKPGQNSWTVVRAAHVP
jgi:hypothetical protein